MKPAISKKVRAVKPQPLIKKIEVLKPVSHKFTFFETLEDKTMTKYVGLHGEMLPVSPPSKPVFASKVKKLSKQVPPPISKLVSQKNIKEMRVPLTPLRFAVQVSSFRNEKMARELKTKLKDKGFDSFLMETELPNQGGKWFRVFLGKYNNEELARKDAKRARKEYKLNAVVLRKLG